MTVLWKFLKQRTVSVTSGFNLQQPVAFAHPRKLTRCFEIFIPGAVFSASDIYALPGRSLQYKPVSFALSNWFSVIPSSLISFS